VAREAAGRGMLLVPGTLFSPSQTPSTLLRFAVTMEDDAKMWRELAVLQRGRAG
jgi:DNA-binding transcriptional MocR family regulator